MLLHNDSRGGSRPGTHVTLVIVPHEKADDRNCDQHGAQQESDQDVAAAAGIINFHCHDTLPLGIDGASDKRVPAPDCSFGSSLAGFRQPRLSAA